jgi:hypothetical protein
MLLLFYALNIQKQTFALRGITRMQGNFVRSRAASVWCLTDLDSTIEKETDQS